ncbi:MAG TPA: lamin tail domain-containing protein, partial [Myxococcaceae bacterium]|nr:lamin tail domain-containing protein [Myxococcaceae bacterium]
PGDGGVPEERCLSWETGGSRAVVAPHLGDVVLTEFMADPRAVADATGEWVELYARRDVDLNGVTLANEGSGRTTLEATRCLRVKAGAYAVLARSADHASNGGLPPVLGTFSFSLGNSAAARALRLSRKGTLLDEVRWTSEALPGVSWQLEPKKRTPEGNDEPGSFCATPDGTRYGRGDRGTPGGENRPCAP